MLQRDYKNDDWMVDRHGSNYNTLSGPSTWRLNTSRLWSVVFLVGGGVCINDEHRILKTRTHLPQKKQASNQKQAPRMDDPKHFKSKVATNHASR